MKPQPHANLARRERQIVETIYRLGRATVTEVRDHLEDPPSYSAVRAMLRILEEKGYLRHAQEGPRYVYLPVVSQERAKRTILRDVVRTLFDGSTEQAVAALLDGEDTRLSDRQLQQLSRLIEAARRQGR